MAQVSYPGVYIQEIPSGVNTITGVSTSIASFFGRTLGGQINKPIRCNSYSEFVSEFIASPVGSDLQTNVKQFFDNGGSTCYVTRIAHGAENASLTLKNFANNEVLKINAKYPGLEGNQVQILVDYNTQNSNETFNLKVIKSEDGILNTLEEFTNLSTDPNSSQSVFDIINLSSNTIKVEKGGAYPLPATTTTTVGFSQNMRPLPTANLPNDLNNLMKDKKFEISINNGPFVSFTMPELTATDLTTPPPLSIATEIANSINTRLNIEDPGKSVTCQFRPIKADFHILRINSASGNNSSIRIRSVGSDDMARSLMFGIENGGIEYNHFANWRPVPNASILYGDLNGSVAGGSGWKNLEELMALGQAGIDEIRIDGETIDMNEGGSNMLETTAVADDWFKSQTPPVTINDNNDGIKEKLIIIKNRINDKSTNTKAELWGYHLVLISKDTNNFNAKISSADAIPTATPPPTVPFFNDSDFKHNTIRYVLGTAGTSTDAVGGILGTDDDGTDLMVPDFEGDQNLQTGFYAMDKVDIFNLMVIPKDTQLDDSKFLDIYDKASNYCKNKRAFLLIDAPDDWHTDLKTLDKIKVDALRARVQSDHSAVFFPKIQYKDNDGKEKFTGPSGTIAGVIANIDATRGIWKSPAGLEAKMSGVLDLYFRLSDLKNGELNKLGTNCLRSFDVGFVNWGARTMAGSDDIGSEYKYIAIRRMALFIEESLYRGTRWAVFEPNDEPLWASLRLNIGAFMNDLFRQGAFQGSSPSEAYFIKVDKETTTQSDRNKGIVNIIVGFAPLKPAEFIVIKIQQMVGDLGGT